MLLLIAYKAGAAAPVARRGLRFLLEVILHIGAHRTGTTSLQRALQQNRHNLRKVGVAFWGPRDTRGGLFSGLLRASTRDDDESRHLIKRNRGAIKMEMKRLEERGVVTLLVSEENIMGSMRNNLHTGFLYPGLAGRLAQFAQIFGPSIRRVALCIRPYEDYWASAMTYAIRVGHRPPEEADLDRLVTQPRSWSRVVTDVAQAFSQAEVAVWEFDRLIGRPQAQFRVLTGGQGRIRPMSERHNASPGREVLRALLNDRGEDAAAARIAPGNGSYRPFGAHHRAAFDAQYQCDLAWLRARSADELRFVEAVETRSFPPQRFSKRGFG